MKAIKTTELEGDLAQGRNITAGGNITAQGNGVVGKNLTVKGWLKARNIIGACKGLFASEERLNSEYPNPHNGWWAMVGTTIPAAIYEADYGAWVATGETGGNPVAEIDDLDTLRSTVDELVTYLAIGILIPDSVKVTSDATSVKMTYTLQLPDNTTTDYTVSMPIASTTAAGVMTAEDKQNLSDVMSKATSNSELITSLQTQINTLTGSNASEAIENFNEVIAFLSGVTDDETLTALLTELKDSISANAASIKTANTEDTAHHTVRFDGIVSGVTVQQQSAISIEGVYYDDVSNVFVARNGLKYYGNWITDDSTTDMYMNSSRTEILKDKVYLCGSRLYYWDEEEGALVSVVLENMIGAANGVAPLDGNKQVPASNLPVDICNVIVVDYWDATVQNIKGAYSYDSSTSTLEQYNGTDTWEDVTLRTDVIYVDKTNKVPYIWDGTSMVAIAPKDTPASIYNVNVALDKPDTYYKIVDADTPSQSAAHVSWEQGVAVSGLILSFKIGQSLWKTYQYTGTEVTEAKWTDESNWQDFGSLAAGSETYIIIDNLVGSPSVGEYYTLQSAVTALLAYEKESGVTYSKKGLIISYCTGENTMETKQFQGEITDIGETGLWKDFGGGSKVETKDEPEKDGTDALSTGGAYTAIPTDLKVDTETEGVVKISMVNAAGDTVGNEQQFTVGTGSGSGGGTIVTIALQSSAVYSQVGGTVTLNACIRSITTSGTTETPNGIERVELYDRDTNVLMKSYTFNRDSSDEGVYDFALDITSMFTSAGSKKMKLIAYDDAGENTGSRNFTAVAVDVTIESSQTLGYTSSSILTAGNDASKALPMYKFPNNTSSSGIKAITEIYLNGTWQTLGEATITDTYSHSISINPCDCLGSTLTHGAYPLRIHGVDIDSGVVGNYLHTAVMVVDADSTVPIVVSRWYTDGESGTVKRYETLSVEFSAYDPSSRSVEVSVYENDTLMQTKSALRGSIYTYSHQVTSAATDGTEDVTIRFKAGSAVSETAEWNVSGSAIEAAQTEGAIYAFDFSGRSNSDTDHSIESGDYSITLEGSNYSSNGFGEFLGEKCLAIKENVKATLNHAPFANSGIETNGLALLFKFASQYSVNDDTKLMQCHTGDGAGFYITGNKIVMECADGEPSTVWRRYPTGTAITVGLVVEPATKYITRNGNNYSFMKLFLDGEEVGCIGYKGGTGALVQDSEITFNGTDADFYLYYMMAWETYPAYRQAFYDYLVKLTDTEAMITEYDFEDVFANSLPNAAAMYERGMSYLIEAPYNGSDVTALDKTTSTSLKNYITLYYYDAKHPWRSFKATDVQRRNQGTTSTKRPIKNSRYYLNAKKGSTYDKTAKSGGTVVELLLTDTSGLTSEQLADYETTKKLAANNYVRVGDNTIPVQVITVKVDFSDSSNANDCGACNMMNATYRALGSEYMTPAQRYYDGTFEVDDETTLTGLELNHSTANHPIAVFRSADGDVTNLTFYAKGNWKEDKGEQTALGFLNTPGYNKGCLNYGDFTEYFGTDGETMAVIESRFKADTTLDTSKVYKLTPYCGSSYRFYRYQDGAWTDTTGSMRMSDSKWVITGDVLNPVDGFEIITYTGMAWFRGVSSIDDMMAASTQKSSWVQKLLGNDDSVTVPAWTYYFECMIDDDQLQLDLAQGKKVPYWLYRFLVFCNSCDYEDVEDFKAVWKANAYKYMNVKSVMAYDAFCDYNGAFDQMSKNMQPMFFLDDGGEVVDGEYNDESYVRMYPNKVYDADGLNMKDNEGGEYENAEVDPNKATDETEGYTNPFMGWGSVLWRNLYFQPEVVINAAGDTTTMKTVVDAMRSVQATVDGVTLNPFSPDGAKHFFIENICKAWQKTVSSHDGESKFINAEELDSNGTPTGTLYFYAMFGLRLTELAAIIDTRWRFRDGFYGTGDFFTGTVAFRMGAGVASDAKIPFTAAKSGYFGIGNEKQGNVSEVLYVEAGETAEFSTFAKDDGAQMYIYQCDRMSALDLSQLTLTNGVSFANCSLMETLTLGGESHTESGSTYPNITQPTMGALPFLQELNIVNTKIATLDLSGCPRLETLNATGSALSSLTLAQTSPVSTLTLPATMTNANFVNLPNLTYPGGLTFESLANITRLFLSGCPNIDAEQLLGDIVDAGAAVKYVRVADVNMTSSYKMLQSIIDDAAVGLDENGTTIEETGQCSGITGRWILRELVEDGKLEELQKYFPELTIYNSQFSCVVFDDTADDTANISNTDNETGYAYGNSFEESGHWAKIKANCHIYKTVYDSTNKKLKLTRVSDSTYTELADGTEFDPTDQSGVGYDLMKMLCHYWYKGVNDYKNQKKYLYGSCQTAEPISTRTNITRETLADIKTKALAALLTENVTIGETFSDTMLSDNSNMNVYCISVEGMKQVRWPGVNTASLCAVFVDADGTTLSTFSMAVSHSLFDFMLGDYVFTDVPSGATKLYFTSPIGFDDLEAIAVDSSETEAIEPDWVERKQTDDDSTLIGVYGLSVDTLMRARSISGQKTKTGTGTATTNADWSYDSDGNLTNGSVTTSTMNYTCQDFMNLCKMRGEGFQAIDYEMSKDIANLYMATKGERDEQTLVGYGCSAQYTSGKFDGIGNADSGYSSGNGNKILGLENFVACNYEWMDNVAVNIDCWEAWEKAKRVAQSGWTINQKWHIYDPVGKTERTVQGINTSGYCIARVKFGRYADTIPSKCSSDNSKWNKNYGDVFYYSNSAGRVVGRASSSAGAVGGLVFAGAGGVSSSSYTYYGSRLAFRGAIEVEAA